MIFEVLDNLLLDGNEQSFQILEEAGAGQRVLNNVERYALYVARALQEQGGNDTSGRTGENIGEYSSLMLKWLGLLLVIFFLTVFTSLVQKL